MISPASLRMYVALVLPSPLASTAEKLEAVTTPRRHSNHSGEFCSQSKTSSLSMLTCLRCLLLVQVAHHAFIAVCGDGGDRIDLIELAETFHVCAGFLNHSTDISGLFVAHTDDPPSLVAVVVVLARLDVEDRGKEVATAIAQPGTGGVGLGHHVVTLRTLPIRRDIDFVGPFVTFLVGNRTQDAHKAFRSVSGVVAQ